MNLMWIGTCSRKMKGVSLNTRNCSLVQVVSTACTREGENRLNCIKRSVQRWTLLSF